jgi:hypothetical protein
MENSTINPNLESSFYVGVDLGQSLDYTAVVVLQALEPIIPEAPAPKPRDNFNTRGIGDSTGTPARPRVPLSTEPVTFIVNHVYRFELGTPYTVIEAKLIEYYTQFKAWGYDWDLIVDSTGVGRPVIDSLRSAGLKPIAVTVHGGVKEQHDTQWDYSVPKRDLVGAAQLLLGKKLLTIADQPLKETLEKELRSFQVDVSKGHDTYGNAESGPWRIAENDDIVFALSLACWRVHHVFRDDIRVPFGPVSVGRADDDEPFHSMFWDREHKANHKFKNGL